MCCSKKVYSLGPLEDTVMIQFAWGLFFFQEIMGLTSILTNIMFAGCPQKNSFKYILFGKNWKLTKIFQFWSLTLKQSPRLIGNYFCRNGIFPIETDTLYPREKWVFSKLPAVNTTSDCLKFIVFFSLFTTLDPSEAIKP